MRGLEKGEKDGSVQQRSPTLAKFHQLERTCRAVSHSRWAALSSANGGMEQPQLVVKHSHPKIASVKTTDILLLRC